MAAALLIGTVLSVAGTFSRGNIPHRAYFKFAGGLQPGAAVRFGGMKAGSVQGGPGGPARLDPHRGRLQRGSRHPVEDRQRGQDREPGRARRQLRGTHDRHRARLPPQPRAAW